MRASKLVIAAAAVGLVGFGMWLGRSSPAQSEPAAAPRPAPRTAAIPAPVRAPVAPTPPPQLQRPAPSRALLADLTDADVKVRRAAVHEVTDAQALLAASRDPDLEVGVVATAALGRLYASGEVPAAELLARASDHGLNERVRTAAMDAVAAVQAPETAAYLADILARGDTFERANAAILIGHQDLEVAMPALIRALGDGDAHVRDNALETLRSRSRGRDFGTDAAAWQAWWQSRPR